MAPGVRSARLPKTTMVTPDAEQAAAMLRSTEVRRLRATLATVLDDLLLHDGYGHIQIDMKILKRGQKEVVIACGKEYRFVIDYANPRTEEG